MSFSSRLMTSLTILYLYYIINIVSLYIFNLVFYRFCPTFYAIFL
nr:MAG TPA: hypothetical protein [Caudoviricetes sp.]